MPVPIRPALLKSPDAGRHDAGSTPSTCSTWRAALALLLFTWSTGVWAETPATRPTTEATTQETAARPYKIEVFEREQPRWRGQVVRIDLTDPRLSIAIGTGGPDPDADGAWETVLQPTSVIAKANQFDVAINTVFFMHKSELKTAKPIYRSGDWASSVGWVVSDGKVLSARRQGISLVLDRQNRASIGTINTLPPDINVMAAGSQQLVFRGQALKVGGNDRAPRTAVGIAGGGKTLVLFVIDGRRDAWSVGMTMQELADQMAAFGCEAALNFDGGGSSTLVTREGDSYRVINTPSDGSTLPIPLSLERSVPYVLGFKWK